MWHWPIVTRVFNQATKHWVQFLPLELYCCQNWQELLQKHHFHHHIIQFINAMEMTINLANKRKFPRFASGWHTLGPSLKNLWSLTNKWCPSSEISTATNIQPSLPANLLCQCQQIHHCRRRKVQRANISWKISAKYEPKLQDLLIFGCVYSLDYLSFPILVLWKSSNNRFRAKLIKESRT